MITLSASNIAWAADEDAHAQRILRDTGITTIEVAPARLFSNVATATRCHAIEARRIWTEHNLPIASMQALFYGRPELKVFGNSADKTALIDHLSHVIQLASALGAGPLVFGSPKNREKGNLTFTQAKTRAVSLFREIGDLCAATGTVFCLEANAVQYGCDFMTTLEETVDVVTAVDHPHVALVVDTGNMLLAGDLAQQLDAIMDYIAHVHISAPELAPITSEANFIRSVATHLQRGGYHRAVTLEMRRVNDNLATFSTSAKLLAQLFQTSSA